MHMLFVTTAEGILCFALIKKWRAIHPTGVRAVLLLTVRNIIIIFVELLLNYHARHKSDYQKQFRVQFLAQGHFCMWTGGARDHTNNPVFQ